MIYTDLTMRAMRIAYKAHHGQYDRGGVPYVFHPIHVAEQMDDEYSTCVALLHDVVEDTYISLEDLKKVFPKEVTDAVSCMTRDFSISYFDYVRGIAKNAIATKVKLADLTHNMDVTRITDQEELEIAKDLHKRYEKAKRILSGEEV